MLLKNGRIPDEQFRFVDGDLRITDGRIDDTLQVQYTLVNGLLVYQKNVK